jgi:transcriptional regulator with XRE-family HTH domain
VNVSQGGADTHRDVPSDALADLGRFIRAQREVAHLSLRHVARMTGVSDSYLSQVERGLYQPSGEVIKAIAAGLGISSDALFRRLGWLTDEPAGPASVLAAIAADTRLSQAQKMALAHMYNTMADGA